MTPPLVQLLDLSHNFISRIPYQVILHETKVLNTLHFTHSMYLCFGLTTIHQFLAALSPSLRSLDISFNQLADLDGSSLENLSNLQILRLHHNKISSIQKLGLANIQIIDLSSNQVVLHHIQTLFWRF